MQGRPKIDSPIFSDKEVQYEEKEECVANHPFYVKTLLTFLRDPAIMIVFLGKAVKNRTLPLRASRKLPGRQEGPGSRESIIVDPPLSLRLIQATANARALVDAAYRSGTAGDVPCASSRTQAGRICSP
jgi:hypothetical protein